MSNAKKADELPHTAALLEVMSRLRNPKSGCPWDVEQTMESLTRYTIEEAYEVADAIATGDMDDIKDELGDLLFQVVFYAQIATESDDFDFDDVARGITQKLIRRHPHVFDSNSNKTEDLSAQWEAIKAAERQSKGAVELSILDTVPEGLPALMLAQKLQKQCAKVGFDWPDVMPVIDKVLEEVQEVKDELANAPVNQSAVEEEIGDLLFAVVNLARHCEVDADTALRNASHKFSRRFKLVERMAAQQSTSLENLSLEAMESLWQQAKSPK